LTAMRYIIPKAHWEVCKGSHTQNKVYCTKAETRVDGPWEHGKEPSQGERVDLVALKETMDSGASMKQIVQEHPAAFLRYGRSIREYRQIMQPERDWKTYVEFHWGVTGCGKSHYAKTTYPGAYRKASSKWWDGYDSHEVVIMDEFYGLHFDPSYMLQLMDQYGFQVEVKCGTTQFLAKRLIITSNRHWHHWWPGADYSREAFARRIDKTVYYDKIYVAPTLVLDPPEVAKEEPTRVFSIFKSPTENEE